MITRPLDGKPGPEAPAEGVPSAKAPAPGRAGRAGRRRTGHVVLGIGGLAAVALAGALAAGTVPRLRQEQAVNAEAAAVADSPPRVTVAVARAVAPDAQRVLPGNALPLLDAALYARTTGYVKVRHVDIGDRVRQGQVLAEISAPDVDDQLAQARANLAQAQANLPLVQAEAELAQITLSRDTKAGPGIAFPLEQLDQDRAKVRTTAAQVAATRSSIQVNEAAVQRFTDLQGFQKITAPFPGVITARNIDPGDLVSADSPTTSKELFHIMRTDVLRVFVNVPQVFVAGVRVGQRAVVYQRDDPSKQFACKVTRTADALDANTRTLLTEVQVPNPENALRPGMYLQVQFVFDRDVLPILIPAAALATRTEGPRVAVLDDQHRVHYRTVQLGRDYGAEIEVTAGLKAGDTVAVHPGDDLPEGTAIEPVPLAR